MKDPHAPMLRMAPSVLVIVGATMLLGSSLLAPPEFHRHWGLTLVCVALAVRSGFRIVRIIKEGE